MINKNLLEMNFFVSKILKKELFTILGLIVYSLTMNHGVLGRDWH
ncbi:hypothetical protein ADICYQ_0444 [Cyclobacterium qasimii M12-11B]|uniref:Uncharacterized protein n=1 Tax=Cyclobacterium qasimii M12-11B TaxID=641524 RepID=S7VN25_9BACT|nr:hypothetical protein ADICYQ_0444 [Cyclobacterium qasimii M12-11B]